MSGLEIAGASLLGAVVTFILIEYFIAYRQLRAAARRWQELYPPEKDT